MGPAWAADLGAVCTEHADLVVMLHHMGGIGATDPRSSLETIHWIVLPRWVAPH